MGVHRTCRWAGGNRIDPDWGEIELKARIRDAYPAILEGERLRVVVPQLVHLLITKKSGNVSQVAHQSDTAWVVLDWVHDAREEGR